MAMYTDINAATRQNQLIPNVATDASAINNSIKNILLTPIGQMPGKPTFGSNITKVLFSHLDHVTASVVENDIRHALTVWEKRIIVTAVTASFIPEYNKLIASIKYIYRDKGLNVNEQISVALLN